MISRFSKKVMIEQAELYRLKQRQILEHLPVLQAMARLLNNMSDIMVNNKLTKRVVDLDLWHADPIRYA